jgi:hypothetical protein
MHFSGVIYVLNVQKACAFNAHGLGQCKITLQSLRLSL